MRRSAYSMKIVGQFRELRAIGALHARTVCMQPAEICIGYARTQSFRAFNGARLCAVGKHHAELITTIARHKIHAISSSRAQELREFPQKRIPASMPIIVIPLFEAVDKFQACTMLGKVCRPSNASRNSRA
jgi:hypothetical protein